VKQAVETILIVDSDKAHRERNSRLLRATGYRVLEARGYQDAENMWQRHPGEISLLVTAMALPERNGYDLAWRLRSVEPAVKILFISGATGAVIAEFQPDHIQGTSTLYRPFGAGELVGKVRELLKNGLTSAAGS